MHDVEKELHPCLQSLGDVKGLVFPLWVLLPWVPI